MSINIINFSKDIKDLSLTEFGMIMGIVNAEMMLRFNCEDCIQILLANAQLVNNYFSPKQSLEKLSQEHE